MAAFGYLRSNADGSETPGLRCRRSFSCHACNFARWPFSGNTAYIAGGQDFGSQFLGLYSTTDDGFNWNNLSSEWPSTSAMAVTVDPSNPQKILAGTTRGGLVVSTDGGATWSYSVGNTGTYQVNDIEYVPGSSSNLYLGLGSVAVLRSTVTVSLVFTDVQMPGTMDGLGLARWVLENRPEIPVIVTSGRLRSDDLSGELAALGPVEQKPYSENHLLGRIIDRLGLGDET